jgi:Cd2+/Zn2+-exporting ATPase
LVIACPCALVISTPVTVVSGLAAAARAGILVKGGAYLEQARRIRTIALDKTGTLTHGNPAVTDIVTLEGLDEHAALRLAAALDVHSDHPVARAIVSAWKTRVVAATSALPVASSFEAILGRGVKGVIDGGEYLIGNHRLIEDLGICSPALESKLARLEQQGKTATVLVGEAIPLAILAVADSLRDSSVEAVRSLHNLGVRTIMLTGDNPTTAQTIAAQAGIDDVRANLLPENKLSAIEALVAQHGVVGMVGDGINDAPALAKASIGFAMGAAGSDTALETADVALMQDDLRKLPEFIGLSRATAIVLAQNIWLSIGIKAIFFALALTGQATLWMAVFADMGASLLVVFNGLRLLRR